MDFARLARFIGACGSSDHLNLLSQDEKVNPERENERKERIQDEVNKQLRVLNLQPELAGLANDE